MSKTLRFRSGPQKQSRLRIDHEAGIISGVAIITQGKTKPPMSGSGPIMIDGVTLSQVAAAVNAQDTGIKARLTHPTDDSMDDLPTRLGYVRNARVDGNTVRGDLVFYDATGEAARRLLAICEHDPSSCGLSIAMDHGQYHLDQQTQALRVTALSGVDIVGEPAANPAGMLSADISEDTELKGTDMDNEMEFSEQQMQFLHENGLPVDASPETIIKFIESLSDDQKAELKGKVEHLGPSTIPTELSAERRRCSLILGMASRAGKPTAWAQERIQAGASVEDVAEAIQLSTKRTPADMQTTTTTVTGGNDLNLSSIGPAVSDALSRRMGAKIKNPHPRAIQFEGRSLTEVGRLWLSSLGVHDAQNLSRAQLAAKMMRSRGLALSQSTSDFPSLMADSLGKALRNAYDQYPQSWQAWCGRRVAPDFKEIKSIQLHSYPTPIEKPEGDDITYVSLDESQEVYRLKTYSNGTKLTREAIVNDDLSAFDSLPRSASAACRRLEDDLAYVPITGNAALSDNVALFATAHANIGTGALTQASLGAGRVKMALQTDAKGTVLNLRPRTLLVPVVLEDLANQLVSSQELRTTEADTSYVTNTYSFLSGLQVVADPRLDQNSSTQWYLASDPQVCDTVELAFLQGEESPVVEEDDDFDSDTRRFKVRHNVAAKALDHRGLYRSSGS